MEKIIAICFFFLLFNYSYSQQQENKVEMFLIAENSDIKNHCEVLYFQYPSLVLYICSREKYIYTPLLQDTLIAVFEFKIRFHYIDTSAYFIIEEINKLTPEIIIFDKDKEREFVNSIVYQVIKTSKIYYEGQKDELEGRSCYMNIPLKFIPIDE
jgi:hypothetical protein